MLFLLGEFTQLVADVVAVLEPVASFDGDQSMYQNLRFVFGNSEAKAKFLSQCTELVNRHVCHFDSFFEDGSRHAGSTYRLVVKK